MATRLLVTAFVLAVTCLAPLPTLAQYPTAAQTHAHSRPTPDTSALSRLTGDVTVSRDPLSFRPKVANLPKARAEAEQLTALARELQRIVNNPKAGVPAPEITNRARKISRLAKQIREEVAQY